MADLTYIALLRGINVGGHKLIKMDQLRKSFEALGWDDVRTYVQSGNVVFHAPKQPPERLSKKAEEKILRDFGFSVPVVIRSSVEIGKTIQANPFLKEKGIEVSRLAVAFLAQTPEKAALNALEALALTTRPDQFRHSGKDVYLYLPNGFGNSKLANGLERVLSVATTARNWNTVNKLYAMSVGASQ
jgi:uncharacterized protein (DUF1697 family)